MKESKGILERSVKLNSVTWKMNTVSSRVALTYYVITEGGSLEGLCMIMGEGVRVDLVMK